MRSLVRLRRRARVVDPSSPSACTVLINRSRTYRPDCQLAMNGVGGCGQSISAASRAASTTSRGIRTCSVSSPPAAAIAPETGLAQVFS